MQVYLYFHENILPNGKNDNLINCRELVEDEASKKATLFISKLYNLNKILGATPWY